MKFIRIFLLLGIIISMIGCGIQNQIIFPADKLDKNFIYSPYKNGKEIHLITDDGLRLSAIKFDNFKSEKIILYFHGNAGSLDSWRYEYDDLEQLKTDIIFVDYRGYGKSEGVVTEKGLYLDAKALYDFARKTGYQDSNIIIYGRSIGTGIAVDLAQNKKIFGLILESPYSSFKKFAYHEFWYMMPFFYLSYSLNSCEKIKHSKTKVLIIHGSLDNVIPIKYGKELFSCFDGEKSFVEIKGGMHNDLSQYSNKLESIKTFLKN